MNIENLRNLIGVKLWAIPSGANNRGKNEPLQITIESVGRKYAYVNGGRYKPSFYETHAELNCEWHRNYLVFDSEKAMNEYVELKLIVGKAKSFFDHWCKPDSLTLEQWRKVGEIIDSSSKG